jgi:mono/diheme cytochrome c family protein
MSSKVKGLAALLLAVIGSSVFAQSRVDFGQREYLSSCASCHGVSGKGDGVLVRHLVKAPSDLTLLSRGNGGVFPTQRVWEMIDGGTSTDIGPHGSREMPVWGNVFRSEDPQAPEGYARSRMAFVLDYLARIQEK